MGFFDKLFTVTPQEKDINEINMVCDFIAKILYRSDSYVDALGKIYAQIYNPIARYLNLFKGKCSTNTFNHLKFMCEYEIDNIKKLILISTFFRRSIQDKNFAANADSFINNYSEYVYNYLRKNHSISRDLLDKQIEDINIPSVYSSYYQEKYLPNFVSIVMRDLFYRNNKDEFDIGQDKVFPMSLYGVDFSHNYNEILNNGLNRNYEVECTYKPKDIKPKIYNIKFDILNLAFMKGENNIPAVWENHNILYSNLNKVLNKTKNITFDLIKYKISTSLGKNEILYTFYSSDNVNRKLIFINFNYDSDIESVFKERYGNPTRRKFNFADDEICRIYRSQGNFAILSSKQGIIYNPIEVDRLIINVNEVIENINIKNAEKEKRQKEENENREKEERMKKRSEI